MEKFSIPCVGVLIIKETKGRKYLLLQERWKNIPEEDGLLEFPAGKIREFENIFEALKREVREESGLIITNINTGKIETERALHYEVHSYTPFYSVQNTIGNYPVMMNVFVCEAEGILLNETNESKNISWWAIEEVEKLLNQPNKFYAMHLGAIRKLVTELLEKSMVKNND